MSKIKEYNDVSHDEMSYYIPQVISSILNGTDFPVSNKPSTNRFITDFYNAYMYVMMHSTSLPYVKAC